MATLNLRGLKKSFGDFEVLSGVDLFVEDQELVAVLGASGSGKSTLLRLIAGFEKPTAGTIELAGDEISSVNKVLVPEKRNIGIVPQDAALFPHLSVSQNIGFGLVALARALAPRPAIVLMDEPFSALDAELRTRLRLDVKAILQKEGATAILVTHDQEEALSLADRVAVLRSGQIVQVGSPTEIYNSPVDIGIATFLGDSVLIDGEVKNGKVVTLLGALSPLNKVTEGQVGRVAIRGENFYLLPNPKGEGEVVGQVFFGHDAVVEVVTKGIKIRARSNGPFAPEVGMRVSVWVRGSVNFYPG